MSRVLFDYDCSACAHEFEELVYRDDPKTIACPSCQKLTATRRIAAPTIDPRMGVSSTFSTMADRWAKVRRQRLKHAEKLQRDHGDIR